MINTRTQTEIRELIDYSFYSTPFDVYTNTYTEPYIIVYDEVMTDKQIAIQVKLHETLKNIDREYSFKTSLLVGFTCAVISLLIII